MIEMTRAYLEMIHPSSVVEMQDEMDRLSLSISLKTLFQNTSFDEVGFTRDFGGIGEDLTSYIRFPFPPIAVPIPRNRRLQQKIALVDRHIWRIIEERRLHPQPEADILQTLIECNEPRQVRDEMLTLVLAGYQTTAQTLSFAWSLLAQHPTAMQKLYDEIEQVLHGRNLSVDDLSKFVYARHILMETLRLYPPSFGLIRESVQEDEIFGHKVAAHTVVCMAPYYTHRHPLFWEDPESFDPDRFLPERGGIKHRYAYVPFGGGPHQCLGNHFAIQEALIILIMVAQRYHVRFADPSFQPEVRALAMMKMRELPMVFEER
jgi:cytochrome P450